MTETPIEIQLSTLRTTLGDDLVQDLEDSVAPNTWRAYRSDLADFATWVAYTGADWRAPEVVAAYLRTLEDGGAASPRSTSWSPSPPSPPATSTTRTPPNTPGSESRSRRSAAAWAPTRIKPTPSLPSDSSRSSCRSTPPPSRGYATWRCCWSAGTGRCAAPNWPVCDATTCHWTETASCCNSPERKRPRTIRCGCRLLTNLRRSLVMCAPEGPATSLTNRDASRLISRVQAMEEELEMLRSGVRGDRDPADEVDIVTAKRVTSEDLEGQTVKELRADAQAAGVTGFSKMAKKELIDAIVKSAAG